MQVRQGVMPAILVVLSLSRSAAVAIDLKVENVPVRAVVQLLRSHECTAISFIGLDQTAAADRMVSLDLRNATAEEILAKIAEQIPAYRSEKIGGRLVLFPAAPEYQVIIERVNIESVHRQVAADRYVDIVREAVPALSALVPPVLYGDDRQPEYSDIVSLRQRGRVIEHLVDLLGHDQALYFEFIKARSGVPSLNFERVNCLRPNTLIGQVSDAWPPEPWVAENQSSRE